jgi:putative transposase
MVRGTRTMAGKLVTDPCDYKYSTARFYKLGIKDFGFIKDLREEF